MCDFKPGDEVVFIGNPDFIIEAGGGMGDVLEKDVVYTVEDIGFVAPFACVLISGHHNSKRSDGFYAAMVFRKVQRRDLSAWLKTATKFEGPKRAKVDA